MPSARRISAIASVPLPTPTACARAARRRELGFERLDFRTEHEPAAGDHALDGGRTAARILTRRRRANGMRSAVMRAPCRRSRRVHVVIEVLRGRTRACGAGPSRSVTRGVHPVVARELRRVRVEAADVDRLLLRRPLDVLDASRPGDRDQQRRQVAMADRLVAADVEDLAVAARRSRPPAGTRPPHRPRRRSRAAASRRRRSESSPPSIASRMNQPMKPWRLWRISWRGP